MFSKMESFILNGSTYYRSSCGNHEYPESAVIHSALQGCMILRQYALFFEDRTCISQAYRRDHQLEYPRVLQRYSFDIITDAEVADCDMIHCADTSRLGFMDDVYWSEVTQESYEFEDNWAEAERSGDMEDDVIHPWHSTSHMSRTLTDSVARVGYEIEKARFTVDSGDTVDNVGDYVGSYELFRGYETDGSCGVEAITNVLPAHAVYGDVNVQELINDAHLVINSSINRSCGGHFTVSYKDFTSVKLLQLLKPYIPLFYAMYPERLRNGYCNSNIKLLESGLRSRGVIAGRNRALEVRLPAAVVDTTDLWFRHRIIVTMMDYAFVKEDSTLTMFLDAVEPILREKYSLIKLKNVLRLARKFHNWIVNDKISCSLYPVIQNHVRGNDRARVDAVLSRYYTIKIRKRGFRKPLILGSSFPLTIKGVGTRSIRCSYSGLTYLGTKIDMDPSDLNTTVTLANGTPLTWSKVQGAHSTAWMPTAAAPVREPIIRRVRNYWWSGMGTNLVIFDDSREIVTVLPEDIFEVYSNGHWSLMATERQCVRGYGTSYIRVNTQYHFVNGRKIIFKQVVRSRASGEILDTITDPSKFRNN